MFPSNLTTEFNLDAMRMMAVAASTAYCKPSEAEAKARAAGAVEFRWIESTKTDTQILVAATTNDLVISPRGTEEKVSDWITDSKFLRRKLAGFPGEVHDGFADAFESVRDDLRQAVFELSPHRLVWLGGHSLGAALDVLIAYDIVNGGTAIAGCYGFGTPRVGDADFTACYNSNPVLRERSFRIENANDIVTRVPGMLMGYRKEGHRIFMEATGGVDADPSIWKKLEADAIGLALELSKNGRLRAVETLVKDHFMAAYLERINS